MARSHGLNDEEHAAIRALLEAAPAPPSNHAVWIYPESAGLVWVDRSAQPPIVKLTPQGRAYAVAED
jgi:hypothetical protein